HVQLAVCGHFQDVVKVRIEMNVAGLTDKTEVAYLLVNVVGFKDYFFGDKSEEMAIVDYRKVVAPKFFHPDNRLVRVVRSFQGRDHVVYQILGDHNCLIYPAEGWWPRPVLT